MSERTTGKVAKVKSLAKAMDLFNYFTAQKPELGITELAELSGLLKSSVHNIVSTLEVCGFLEKNKLSGKYCLGVKILRLSNQFYLSNNARNFLRPHMERLCAETGENVYLATLNEGEVVYIDSVFPASSVFGGYIMGVTAPLYCTGVGKAILAFLDQNMIESVIAKGFRAFTPNTFRDGELLKKDLAVTRQRGYAIDNMEHEHGIKCVAVPLRTIQDKVVSALSLSGPSPRFTKERIEKYASLLFDIQHSVAGLILK